MTTPDDRTRTFILECLASSADEAGVRGAGDRLFAVCAEMREAGAAIEYLGALLVPQDELVLHVFESSGPEGVRKAGERAALHLERIVESVPIGLPPDGAVIVPDASRRSERSPSDSDQDRASAQARGAVIPR